MRIAQGHDEQMLVVFKRERSVEAAVAAETTAAAAAEAEPAAARVTAYANIKARALSAAAGAEAASAAARAAAPTKSGAVLARDFDQLPLALVSIDSSAALEALLADPSVAAVLPNRVLHAMAMKNLPIIHQPRVEAGGYTGGGCYIAVIDTGACVACACREDALWRACGMRWPAEQLAHDFALPPHLHRSSKRFNP